METAIIKPMGISIMVLALLIGTGSNAFAIYSEESGRGDRAPGQWQEKMKEKRDKMFAEIGLSEEQLQQIEAKRETKMADTRALYGQMREKREALRRVLEAPETDRAQVDVLVNEISALQAQKVRARVDNILEIKATLTPEQFAQLKAKRGEMRKERKGQWRQHKDEASEG
ncbi:MAG: Spy/CpxP family protein refolding chaperone [Candidatus Omnitrophota bacterium]|nr:Spy/CpxP family protein refolding chaperone [Candidatus Omnitrophota bacterium]